MKLGKDCTEEKSLLKEDCDELDMLGFGCWRRRRQTRQAMTQKLADCRFCTTLFLILCMLYEITINECMMEEIYWCT
jgi:hypothetical protein